MKILIAPDKFKGNLTSFEVCQAISNGIRKSFPIAELFSFPMADGGDGFCSVLEHYYGTEKIIAESVDPLGRTINAFYQWNEREKTAIIELATASGIALLRKNELNPLKATTYGTGILINEAIAKGARKIILGIGGSASTDAGTGILNAIGFQFLDKERKKLSPCGGNLFAIEHIVSPTEMPVVKFQVAADVDNVLFGSTGAAFFYAGQKGANEGEIELLDKGLRNIAAVLLKETGKDISMIAGSGAAGGAAAGLMAYFNIEMKSGVDLVIEASGIQKSLQGAHLLITGEGKLDMQTEQGKVVSRIAALAKSSYIDCVAVCGVSELHERQLIRLGIRKVLSIRDHADSLQESFNDAERLIEKYASSLITVKSGS